MLEDLIDTRKEKNELNKALTMINELQSKLKQAKIEYNALKKEYNNVLNANIRLVDTIKEYNPHHFGGGEGRHDNVTPINDNY